MKEISWQGIAVDMPFDVEESEQHVEEALAEGGGIHRPG